MDGCGVFLSESLREAYISLAITNEIVLSRVLSRVYSTVSAEYYFSWIISTSFVLYLVLPIYVLAIISRESNNKRCGSFN